QAVAALARDKVTVGRGNGHPSLVVHCDGGLALEHVVLPASAAGRLFTTENHQMPGFPTDAHLSTTNRVVNRPWNEKSPVASMVCEDVHRQVQGFSTSRCLVSNFEIRPEAGRVNAVCSSRPARTYAPVGTPRKFARRSSLPTHRARTARPTLHGNRAWAAVSGADRR